VPANCRAIQLGDRFLRAFISIIAQILARERLLAIKQLPN
jgi:hypothetical protein